MSEFYAGDDAFRVSNGSEHFEVMPPRAMSDSLVISLDSYDAPEISLRLTKGQALALANWLAAHASD